MERGNARLKFFDRYLGPLLLLLLTPLRLFRSGHVPQPVRSVALLKTAAIGDTVLASAIISDLRKAGAEVTLFVGGSNYGFAKTLEVDHLVKLPISNPLNALKLIRAAAYDVYIDLDPWPRVSALLTALSRAKLRVGFQTAGQNRHFMYDRTVEHLNSAHEIENYRALVQAAGFKTGAVPQTFGHPWKGGSRNVVFHFWPSGTQSHLKEWPASKWIKLAQVLDGFNFVLTGGPEDLEPTREFLAKVPQALRARFRSAVGVTFEETLVLLETTALLVSVNTGVMHVGAAMGVPTVGLHGPTNPLRWGPVGSRVRSVVSRTEGAATLNLGFEYRDVAYMDGLDVPEVAAACRELLGQPAPQG